MSFGNFGTNSSNVSISYIIGVPVPDEIKHPQLIIAFKSMLKSSDKTREKGIQQFIQIIENQPEVLDDQLQWQWTLIYPKLAIDTNISVRLLAQKAQGIVYSILGKKSQKYIKYSIGPWLCGLYDQSSMVSKSAQDALIRVFPSKEKREMIWKLFRKDLISFVYEAICQESMESLYDNRFISKDEAQSGYQRVIYSCIKVIINLLALKNGSNDDLKPLLDDSKFWKLCYCGNLSVEMIFLQFIRGLMIEDDSLASEYSDKILSTVLKSSSNIKDKSLSDIIKTLTMINTRYPEIWSDKSIKKAKPVIDKIFSNGSTFEYWNLIPELIKSLPEPLKPTEKPLIDSLRKETISTVFTKGVETILKLYPESSYDLLELICTSNLQFDAGFYHKISSKYANLKDNSLDELVKKCQDIDNNSKTNSRISRLEKIIVFLETIHIKSAVISNYVAEALATLDMNKIPLALTILDRTNLYEFSAEDYEKFVSKIIEKHEPLDKKIFQIFIHGKKQADFNKYFEQLIDSIEKKEQKFILQDLSNLFSQYKSLAGHVSPNNKLNRLTIEVMSLLGAVSSGTDPNILADFIVYSVCSHDILISRETSYLILEKLTDQIDQSPQILKHLEKISKVDDEIISNYIKENKKGGLLASKLNDMSETSQKLLESLTENLQGLNLDVVRGNLTNIEIDNIESTVDMAMNLLKGSEETMNFIEMALSSEKYKIAIPSTYLMEYHEGLLVSKENGELSSEDAQQKDTEIMADRSLEQTDAQQVDIRASSDDIQSSLQTRTNHTQIISDHIIAIALFIVEIIKRKHLKPQPSTILSLAVIDESCQVRKACGIISYEDELNELHDTINELLRSRANELIEIILKDKDMNAENFYRSLVLQRLFEIEFPEDLSTLTNRRDFNAQATINYLKYTNDFIKLRNQLSSELVFSTIKLDTLVTLNNLMDAKGQSIPMNRLNMILRNIKDTMESDDAYEETFVPVRIEIVIFLQSIVRFYHSELLSTHWDLIADVIEQNISIVTVGSYLQDVILYYTLRLLLIIMDLSPNTNVGSFDEKQDELLNQIPDTFLAASKGGPILGKTIHEIAEIFVTRKNLIEPLDTEMLYEALDKADNIAFADSMGILLLENIQEKQEELSIEYQLSKSTLEVNLDPEALKIGQHVPTTRKEVFKYLISWLLLLGHFDKSSYELRRKYLEKLHLPLHDMLDFIWQNGLEEPIKNEKIDKYQFISDRVQIDVLARHLFFKAVTYAHSIVRGWYLGQRNVSISRKVEQFTKRYITPYVLRQELDGLTDDNGADFTVEKTERSVKIHYKVDEQECVFEIVFPEVYPLQDISIKTDRLVGISQKRWRGWSATMQAVSISQNGRLNEILNILKRSVTLYFEGVEECAICYAVIHSDLSLPDKTCSTCKKKFHADCLYRWFKTSNDSACPLCRAKFKFKNRQGPNPILA